MKKFLTVALAGVLAASMLFTGCSKKEDKPVDESKGAETQVASDYVDGIYLLKGEVSDKGNFPMGVLEVKDGAIANIEYNEYLVKIGQAKSNDNYPYAEGVAVIADLNAQFNDKKEISEVDFDAVSGATHTKENFKNFASELVEMAKKGETYTAKYKDGEYKAVADEDSHGWLSEVTVFVKHGEIVGIDYAEVAVADTDTAKAGDRKSEENYTFHTAFEVADAVQKIIIDNNGIEGADVEGITGATSTRTTFVSLVEKALETAK